MADRNASPLFMPRGSPEGHASPSKRGNGGNGSDSASVSIKSERITPEFQSLPKPLHNQAFWDDFNSKIAPIPGAYIEEKSSSPPSDMSPFPEGSMPTPPPRSFAPLTSRAEKNRRKVAAESAAIAREMVARETAANDRSSPTIGRPTPPLRSFAPLTSRAEKNRRKAAAESAARESAANENTINNNATALANTALETACRDMQTAADFASLAVRNATMHNMIAKNALQGNVPVQPATQSTAAPLAPTAAPPVPHAAAQPVTPTKSSPPIPRAEPLQPTDLLAMARRRLDDLTADLRKQENEAFDREERLETLLEHARDIRARAVQDRSNGLVIIRHRRKKLAALEIRLLNDEGINPDELYHLVHPLMLEEPVEREAFERMKVEGRGSEYDDESESDFED